MPVGASTEFLLFMVGIRSPSLFFGDDSEFDVVDLALSDDDFVDLSRQDGTSSDDGIEEKPMNEEEIFNNVGKRNNLSSNRVD
jgi:hypothetical protein